MMRTLWFLLLLVALVAPVPSHSSAQSVMEFPRVPSVSSVTVIGPFLYFDLEPVIPQQVFRQWWAEMEACTEVQKPFDDLKWFLSDSVFNLMRGTQAWGIYYFNPPEIVLTRGQTAAQLERTVKHEVLHHLMRLIQHDNAIFNRCFSEQ